MDWGNAMLSPEIANLPRVTDGGPSNIVQSTNFGAESSTATGLNFPNILTDDLDYLELHDLATRSPLRTLSPAALTYELLGHQPGPVSQTEPAPQPPAFAVESPSIPWLGLDTMCERSQKQCSCLKTQLQCIAELCGHVDYDGLKLDQILADARQITQATAQHICCHACQKTSTGLIIFTIALQRVVLMLCHLSDGDDRDHKRMLVMSATDRLEAVVNNLVAAVQKSQQKQHDGQFGSQTARANLDWISGTLQTICRRAKVINSRLHTEAWGYYSSSTSNDAVQTQKGLDIC
ncbi:hypothetical protein CNMCM5623_005086 [Aspergillus felis]|uniref:Uncharacterized protein n=1 Tax=Aspergillus felis TaxID=1287682 RepID=A0A8H6V9G0_9EURO|nr:hypothetical protein CNMCM5623_005086 [Aspergillus felis]KAF7183943.1 hypothetical protein CNMCM7691_004433 [Aspergillus felis]